MRALSYLEGKFLAEERPTAAMLSSLGSLLGKLDVELGKIDIQQIGCRVLKWDLQHALRSEQSIAKLPEAAQRRIVAYFLMAFRNEVLPQLPALKRQAIHNDANDWNVLVREGAVSGLIDFGDMVAAPAVQELAVALAYALMGQDDLVAAASTLIRAYVRHHPLPAAQVRLLYWLVSARLCISVLSSNDAKLEGSASDYTLISEKGAWSLLDRWLELNPGCATRAWLEAAGLPDPDPPAKDTDLLAQRHARFSKAMSTSYRQPIQMERAALQYMYGADGRCYLDCVNNIMHVGHCHPRVVEALQLQASRLNTNTRYLYRQLGDYAERLLAHFPERMDRVFFVNSGSAAADLALRIARTATGQHHIAALEHGYHGNTAQTIAASHYKFAGKGGMPQPADTVLAPLYPGTGRPWGEGLAEDLRLAAFIHESIVGCGGQVALDRQHALDLYREVRRRGGLCIADEVQTGFGRVGEAFWAYELTGLDPDIVVLGKPMGNGHPMGAVVTTADIAEGFETGMEFFSSFGGNPVSCAAGLAVLDVMEDEGLQAHARQLGAGLLAAWRGLSERHEVVAEARGSGLFLGLELVRAEDTRQPNKALADRLVNLLRAEGILLSTDGPAGNVIKFKPPMCFSKENAERLSATLEKTLIEIT